MEIYAKTFENSFFWGHKTGIFALVTKLRNKPDDFRSKSTLLKKKLGKLEPQIRFGHFCWTFLSEQVSHDFINNPTQTCYEKW